MLRRGLIGVALLAMLVSAAGAFAQDAAPTAVQPDGEPAFGTISLNGNFVLDPFLITVIGGGQFPASDLNADCAGFVPANPSLHLTLTGDPTENLRIFSYSDSDPVLVVKTPSGEFLCNDDTGSQVVDPTIEIASAEAGDYAIWLGAFDENQLVPAFLVLTHSAGVTASLFDPANLVDRLPSVSVANNLAAQLQAGLRSTAGAALTATLDPSGPAQVFENASAGGEVLAFETDSRGIQCAGYVGAQPLLNVTVGADAPLLAAFFESTADATLVVVAPDGRIYCNDDVTSGNLNPGLLIPSPAEGVYAIYAGAFDPAAPSTGRLVIAGSGDFQQAILEALQPAAGQ